MTGLFANTSATGAETSLVVAALGFPIQALVILTSPVLRLTLQPEMPENKWGWRAEGL